MKSIPRIDSKFNENECIESFIDYSGELQEDIGMIVNYKNPTCINEKENFEIRAIQKNYDGKSVYRVYRISNKCGVFTKPDTFGCVMNPDEAVVIF